MEAANRLLLVDESELYRIVGTHPDRVISKFKHAALIAEGAGSDLCLSFLGLQPLGSLGFQSGFKDAKGTKPLNVIA